MTNYQELAAAWVKHGYCDDDNLFVQVCDTMRAIAEGELIVLTVERFPIERRIVPDPGYARRCEATNEAREKQGRGEQ